VAPPAQFRCTAPKKPTRTAAAVWLVQPDFATKESPGSVGLVVLTMQISGSESIRRTPC
jgi:hypothetical protein